jgi:hypothetical protein
MVITLFCMLLAVCSLPFTIIGFTAHFIYSGLLAGWENWNRIGHYIAFGKWEL